VSIDAAAKWILGRAVTSRGLSPLGDPLLRLLQYALGLTQREIVALNQEGRAKEAARIREIVTGFPSQTVGVDEAYLIRAAVLATAQLPGDLAEVGVFRGGTARVICEAKGRRTLHLFDTFEGLPAPTVVDTEFRQGEYACDLTSVQTYLAEFEAVFFHQGLFPQTATPVTDKTFSFVHLDVDLYQSTFDAITFFYPRLHVGGVLISHDYVRFPAVRQAFDDYFSGTAQPVIEMTGNQCLVVRVAGDHRQAP
jgi:hypothetical protein